MGNQAVFLVGTNGIKSHADLFWEAVLQIMKNILMLLYKISAS